jgi:hypothetical protein
MSNDSFQEFHAEHPWLFDEGRLIGGKPIPGVGWIFTPRLPVRGPRSRAATSPGNGRRRGSASEEYVPAVPKTPPPSRRTSKAAADAIALATAESIVPHVAPVKAAKAAKAAKSTTTVKSTKAAKSATTAKSAKAATAAKTAKGAAKPAKASKAVKATDVGKAAKVSKATKAAKPAKAAKTAKSGTVGKEMKEPAPAAKRSRAATSMASIKAAATPKGKAPPDLRGAAGTAKKPATSARKTAAVSKVGGVTKRGRRDGAADGATAGSVPLPDVGPDTEAVVDGGSGSSSGRRRRRGRGTAASVRAAIEAATNEALATDTTIASPASSSRRRRSVAVTPATPSPARSTAPAPAPAAVNDPLTFLTFVTEHPLGSTVVGTVASFVSHGAMVDVDGMLCYLPLTALGDPPPRRAREVVERGDRRSFVLVALDPPRRGAELALPGMARLPVAEDPAPARTPSRRGRRSSRTAS